MSVFRPLLVLLLLNRLSAAHELRVSPQGNDDWSAWPYASFPVRSPSPSA